MKTARTHEVIGNWLFTVAVTSSVFLGMRAAQAQTCTLGFSDPTGIGAYSDQARTTFTSGGTPYREPCGAFQASVNETSAGFVWGHFHLMYEDSCVKICSGTYARDLSCAMTGTGCTPIDFLREPRFLGSMSRHHVLQITLAPTGGGGSNSACTSPSGPDAGGCVGTAGSLFIPRSIQIKGNVTPPDAPGPANLVNVFALNYSLRRIQVNVNPPIFAQIYQPSLVQIRGLQPGVHNISSLGVVDRLFFDGLDRTQQNPSTVGSYGFDNIAIDTNALLGPQNLEIDGWKDGQGAALVVDPTASTYGGSSFVVPGAGYNLLRPPATDTAKLPVIGNKIAFDIFIPTAQANPYWVGDAHFFVSIPSAGIYNKPLGNNPLTSLTRGAWSSLVFNLDAQLMTALRQSHPDMQVELAINLGSNLAPTRVDNLHFEGALESVARGPAPALPPCNESNAIDLGGANTVSTVPGNACLKVTNYPGSWVRSIQLQSQTNGSLYPLGFAWVGCVGGGIDRFSANWAQPVLSQVSSACTTLIQLQGSATQSFMLSWWGTG